MHEKNISGAQLILPCPEIDTTLEFFRDILGFRIMSIYPADDPRVVELTGHGLDIQLNRSSSKDNTRISLTCDEPHEIGNGQTILNAPNGTLIELHPRLEDIDIPSLIPSFSLCKFTDQTGWVSGRAGMQYRDLIPDRLGGRFIASHIRIPEGGPVPDYVHFHKIRFQMIYCYKGWVKVVYEDQGPPFVMHPGDCVLQPPMIRHRVLECADGLEVIEIGCPAEHRTCVDHGLELPNMKVDPHRSFQGQKFVRHQAAIALPQPWRIENYDELDFGIGLATDGMAGARMVRSLNGVGTQSYSHNAEFVFWFVLRGNMRLEHPHQNDTTLRAGDAVTIPADLHYAILQPSQDLEFLEVSLPSTVLNNCSSS
ncbi:MAG: cupin [bacterium]